MSSVPGVDHPEVDREAQVTLPGRGITVSARVEYVGEDTIVIRPSIGEFAQQTVATPGDAVELFWRGPEEFRGAPAEVTGVDRGAVARWRLRPTGPATVSQRRNAVRARLALPVEIDLGGHELTGDTIDISEAGARVGLDGFGMLPESGSIVDLRVELEPEMLAVRAEAVRMQARGSRWVVSLHFHQLEEKDADRLRRRVFQALREERARLND